jgi:hypothetical protein
MNKLEARHKNEVLPVCTQRQQTKQTQPSCTPTTRPMPKHAMHLVAVYGQLEHEQNNKHHYQQAAVRRMQLVGLNNNTRFVNKHTHARTPTAYKQPINTINQTAPKYRTSMPSIAVLGAYD